MSDSSDPDLHHTTDHTPVPPPPEGNRTRAEALRAEQLDLLYTHTPFAIGLSVVNALILVVAQHTVLPRSTLAIWLGYVVTLSALRLWLCHRYRRRTGSESSSRTWERPFLAGVLLSGMGWGATGIWLFPLNEPIHQMFVIFLLAGMTAGGVMSLSARREAFLAFALPTLVPIIVSLFLQGTKLSVAMATMGVLFLTLAVTIAYRMYRTIQSALELRYDNQLLITDLTSEVTQRRLAEKALQHAHDDLEARVRERTEELAQANLALRAEVEERQRMAHALQESIERFNRAVQGAQEGLWEVRWTSTDWFNPGTPVYYSPRFKALLGYSDQEFPNVLGSWVARVHPDDWDHLLTTFRRHLENRTPFDLEFRMVTKADDCRWFAVRGQAIWNELGQPIHMSGSLREITEHKELEAQLLQAQKMEAVGRLAAGVAHDFNNLLTPILGYAEVLQAKAPQGSVEARRLGDIRRAALHGAALVRQLLAFGRKQPVTPRLLDLNRELAECEELLCRTLGEDIEVLFELTDPIACIKLDPTQLQQVILNLAANARDAMPNGGCLTLATDTLVVDGEPSEIPPGRYVRLSVTDTGAGMAPEILTHAFEPFFTTKEVGKGSGLGLAVVEGIIAQANGKITVTSQVGLGTTFQILLPEAGGSVQSTTEPNGSVDVGMETILVVEDNAAVRELTTNVLSELGYQVLVAKHGQEALDLAARHPGSIALLLTDIVMPGISGWELARRLEQSRPHLRVLYLSGHPAERLADRAGNRPGSPLLSKPFTSEELARTVRQILAGQKTHS